MPKQYKSYIFHQETVSMCPDCLLTVPAKIIFENNQVWIRKRCPKHGTMSHLLEDDAEFYARESLYAKPGTICKTQTKFNKGCPFDCGLCTEHEQHTCIGLIEVTTSCNMPCRICYANAGKGKFLPLTTIDKMMNFYQDTEFGQAELLQISGGEPTLHPDIIKIIELAREKKFKYVMLNTNGLRIAQDEKFVEQLSTFKTGFEIYLQFDGFRPSTYEHFRGKNYLELKKKAIQNLQKYQIPMTLVATIETGVNDSEVGEIVSYGLNTSYVRGINFQPVTFFGRYPEAKLEQRSTLTGILHGVEDQMKGMIKVSDFLPLPCHPERVAFTYLYRSKDGFIPITRGLDSTKYVPMIQNTFTFLPEDFLKQASKDGIAAQFACDCFDLIKVLRPMIPASFFMKSKLQKTQYITENTFRISVSSFIDAYNFDTTSMRKECVHIITPDLKKIPFSAYNLIHRPAHAN